MLTPKQFWLNLLWFSLLTVAFVVISANAPTIITWIPNLLALLTGIFTILYLMFSERISQDKPLTVWHIRYTWQQITRGYETATPAGIYYSWSFMSIRELQAFADVQCIREVTSPYYGDKKLQGQAIMKIERDQALDIIKLAHYVEPADDSLHERVLEVIATARLRMGQEMQYAAIQDATIRPVPGAPFQSSIKMDRGRNWRFSFRIIEVNN